jgi:hypothetical protein
LREVFAMAHVVRFNPTAAVADAFRQEEIAPSGVDLG